MNAFIFANQDNSRAVLRALVPAGINDKAPLLEALYIGLRFPEYFGGNWDALEECIRDLAWLPDGNVILRHADLPLSEDHASLSIYLSVLEGAVTKFSQTETRRLLVIFPLESEDPVRSVMSQFRDGPSPEPAP